MKIEHLRIGDDEKFLEVLGDFVMVVAGEGLHEDAAEHGDGEEDEFGDGQREEFAEPVGGFAHGKRVVDAVEMGVALAPDEFGGVERGDDEEEESGRAFDGLDHEVGDGPDIAAGDASGEVAVVDGEGDEEADERPERNFAKDVGEAEFCERDELAPGCGGAEDLADDGNLAAMMLRLGRGSSCSRCFALAARRLLLTAVRASTDIGKSAKQGDERNQTETAPDEAVVEEDAGPVHQQSVFLDDGPVARDAVHEKKSGGIEDAAPETFEAARGGEDGDADDVDHEDGDALEIDDDDFAGESGDAEKERAEEENLRDDEVEERLEVPPDVAASETGVVGPWNGGARHGAEDHPTERERDGDEGARPAAAEVIEF